MPYMPMKLHRPNLHEAFTRVELLALVAAATLLLSVSLPMLAVFPSREHRAVCANNLRMAGAAVHAWAIDHGDRFPWWIDRAYGGSHGKTIVSEHWQSLSTHLASPSVLACPASPQTPVRDFAQLRDRNVSYFIGSDSDLAYPPMILAGDPDIEGGSPSACSRAGKVAVNSFSGEYGRPETYLAGWSATKHVKQGNLLTADGSVLSTDGVGLRRALARVQGVSTSNHFLEPR